MPWASNVETARTPAGPAPTTATLTVRPSRSRLQHHAVFGHRGAGAQAPAVGKRYPAILASAHQAKASTWSVAELRMTQMPPGKKQGAQQGITLERFDAPV